MASEQDLELLDGYISNRLNAQERSAFEGRMEADPELKGEYQLQNRIAEGIRNARKAELKAMLGAIPTAGLSSGSEGGQMSLPAKIGTWVAATAVVGTGIYFYLTSDQTTDQKDKKEIIESSDSTPALEEPADTQIAESTEVVEPTKPATTEQPAAKEPTVAPAAEPKTKKKPDTSQVKPAGKPQIQAYDPSSGEDAQDDDLNQANIDNVSKATTTDMPVVNDNTSKKYRFHYQIKEGKLTLYGPFEKKLYEVMAFYDNSGSKVTRFLYHESKYYLLTDDNEKVKALSPITDPKLISKLNESRKQH